MAAVRPTARLLLMNTRAASPLAGGQPAAVGRAPRVPAPEAASPVAGARLAGSGSSDGSLGLGRAVAARPPTSHRRLERPGHLTAPPPSQGNRANTLTAAEKLQPATARQRPVRFRPSQFRRRHPRPTGARA